MMEIKKNREVDLERGRTRRLALGLTISVVLLLAVLHLPLPSSDDVDEEELLQLLGDEQELPPLTPPDDMISLAPKVEPPPQTRLVVADEDDESQRNEEPVESDAGDDLPAIDDDELEQQEQELKGMDDEPLSFRVVEDLPQFPGGPVELMKWLTRNLRYPQAAQNQKIQGRVLTEFIVERDGSLTDIHVARSLHPLCDQEALRVLRMMPRWTAGIQNDQPCRTKVCIPIVFKL